MQPPTDPAIGERTRPGEGNRDPTEDEPEALLLELERQHARLCEELGAVEARLREFRTAANVCPTCGGTGRRRTRGGLYGEAQDRPCVCENA